MKIAFDSAWLRTQLEQGVTPLWSRLDRFLVERTVAGYFAWPGRRHVDDADIGLGGRRVELARYLRGRCEAQVDRYARIGMRVRLCQEQLQTAADDTARRLIILDTLADLGADRRRLRGDARAFRRWMGLDAMTDRLDRERADCERELMFLLERLGRLVAGLATDEDLFAPVDVLWQRLDLADTLRPLLAFPGHPNVRESALRCLRRVLCALPPDATVAPDLLRTVYRIALDPQLPVWTQCEAMELIAYRDPDQLAPLLLRRIEQHTHPDERFLRRRAVHLARIAGEHVLARVLPGLAQDTSDYVRQGVAEALPYLPPRWIRTHAPALLEDAAEAVAAQALLALPDLTRLDDVDLAATALHWLEQRLSDPALSGLVARTALRVAAEWPLPDPGASDHVQTALVLERALTAIHQRHPLTPIRREAAQARERLRARALGWRVPDGLATLGLGDHTHVGQHDPAHDPVTLARALSVQAREQFGFDLTQHRGGWRVIRDYRWNTRLWRFLHELRHPSTDKRQNYSHLRGRGYRGLLHVPSGRVAELSRTKVPGEPLHLSEEGGWRPWLPLLDQVLSALDQDHPAQPTRVVTAEGITSISVPLALRARLRAKWVISRDFSRRAALRNWTSDSPFGPDAYAQALAELGISFEFAPHAGLDGTPDPADDTLLKFFPQAPARAALAMPALAMPALAPLGERIRDYAQSLYHNDIPQLVIFVLGLSVWFYAQHLRLNRLFRRARNAIPLVMGGWGTRGKSGTERLKAGVLAGLGLTVVSKTTGCEAMFLYGRANRQLNEMFLFRPYDKATIWEQADLTRIAAALGADVYLWECMGLNPRYVRILQQRWMRDDVSTITNCFPDHEDIQGPAGVDLPQVIAEFIPAGGQLFTSEENMRPYLEAAARARGTPCTPIDWQDAGLITADILDRFPYQEHPYNIALVARMYADLGLPRDVALKEMADHVVADLGVLKIYPEAVVDRRRIVFINGMSANERHGTISNWLRTGMHAHTLETDPAIWTCTVVNNRADRVARSRVFAAMLINDIGADRHVLIGGNLDGLHQFIREAFDEFMGGFDWDDTSRDHQAGLDTLLRRWRIPRSEAEAHARFRAACAGLGADIADIADGQDAERALAIVAGIDGIATAHIEALRDQFRRDQQEAASVAELCGRLSSGGSALQLDVSQTLWALFSSRLITVRDYYTKGNALIRDIVAAAPPGLRIRCMGIQNIKGTGLDFVYRWQAWDRHVRLIERMNVRPQETALDAVRALAESPELGILEYERLADAIASVRDTPIAQNDAYQTQLRALEHNRQAGYGSVFASSEKKAQSHWRRLAIPKIEKLIDGFDAIRRRRMANRIYRDLIDGRIASARAIVLLQGLTQRQKGGWL